jgi:hypothetical protein
MKKGECECACSNSSGIASVILGIMGSVFGMLILPIILSITGLVFGIVQYKKAKNAWAIWGIVLSILGIVISIYAIWQITLILGNAQQIFQTCAADPTAAGCEGLSSLMGGA